MRAGDAAAPFVSWPTPVGASVARDDAWGEMIALAEKHRARVWASPNSGRNSFPENHPLFAGFLAADREKIVASLRGHDLILVLGAPVFTDHVEGFGPHIPDGAVSRRCGRVDPKRHGRRAARDRGAAPWHSSDLAGRPEDE
jgi:benzoylformate decarboxylase